MANTGSSFCRALEQITRTCVSCSVQGRWLSELMEDSELLREDV